MRNLANLEKMIADVERGILALQLSINQSRASFPVQ
jgi:exonuclease VII small subunit